MLSLQKSQVLRILDVYKRQPPWETPQVIPAQLRRVNNLIFRRIGQISRANGVEAVTPMHGWIMEYLYLSLIHI